MANGEPQHHWWNAWGIAPAVLGTITAWLGLVNRKQDEKIDRLKALEEYWEARFRDFEAAAKSRDEVANERISELARLVEALVERGLR